MMSEVKNVSAAKPKIGGAVYTAPGGTSVPTDAVSELGNEFKSLGYVSEDGLTNENTPESENILAWGGDVVASVQTSKEDTFSYKLIEGLNVDVLKEVFGDDNVEGDLETGITVKANNKEHEEHPIVIDMILKGNILKRVVIPNGKVSEIGEITYNDDEVLGYELTVRALPDKKENTHYEYIQKATTDGGGVEG